MNQKNGGGFQSAGIMFPILMPLRSEHSDRLHRSLTQQTAFETNVNKWRQSAPQSSSPLLITIYWDLSGFHSKSQDLGCQFSHTISRFRSPTPTHPQNMHQTLTTLNSISGLKRNVHSLHHFLQSPSPVALFSTKTFLSPELSCLQSPNYFIPASPKLMSPLTSPNLSPPGCHLKFFNRDFQYIRSEIRLPSSSHFLPSTTLPMAVILPFSVYYLQTATLTSTDHSCQITILGNFNVHKKD